MDNEQLDVGRPQDGLREGEQLDVGRPQDWRPCAIRNATPAETEAQRAGIVASANIKGERNCMPLPAPYISIDIETTGLDHSFCQVIEFGAVIEDWVTPVEKLPRFHCYVYHDQIVGQPFALQMNAAILKKLAFVERKMCVAGSFISPDGELFLRPARVAAEFSLWLLSQQFDQDEPLLVAGKNFAGFDRPFLEKLPDWDIPFHHRAIDPAMFFWKPSTDRVPPSTKTCMERAGIAGEVAHTAVEDAIGVIKLVRNAFDFGEPFFSEVADAAKPLIALVWGKKEGPVGPDACATTNTGDVNGPSEPPKSSAREVATSLADYFQQNGQYAGQIRPRR